MTGDKLLHLTPSETLHFKGPYDHVSSSPLHLENKSHEHAIAFKIMSVAPGRFSVKPTNGIIQPGRSAGVHIEMAAFAGKAAADGFIHSHPKFLVKWRTVEIHQKATETGHTLLDKKDGGPIHESKLTCSFEGTKSGSGVNVAHSPSHETVMHDCHQGSKVSQHSRSHSAEHHGATPTGQAEATEEYRPVEQGLFQGVGGLILSCYLMLFAGAILLVAIIVAVVMLYVKKHK